MADPKSTVTSFLTALEQDDVEGALAFAAPDVVYQNVPLPPARGVAAVEKQLRLLSRYRIGFEVRMHHIAADGPIVLTERTDVLRAGAWEARFWVCGTFEVRDDRIVLWRDYFDWATVLASGARGAGRAVVTRVATLLARARLRD
ncbi:limonene-1,2-epoxide hydrolase family protein [Amycolatopsis viridis]|uniref:Limonene-1,2-epoxide hydrolase n=1 Tax=Amycolatopsis viridis TaxID=185678 RepID=A0ABX0SS88_9PSEU|nr:limonene-1,2-epoxide hydrolase family protein [Amycolatopsis viridis]NIH79827.1 limonene-1,2-epoxide hydrolase [Amycolatopsis viridis]